MEIKMLTTKIATTLLAFAGVVATSQASAGEIVAQARFDHAYVLTIQGCSSDWQHYAGKNDISHEYVSGCLPHNATNVHLSVSSDREWDQYPRVEWVEQPSYQNGGRLRALIVEPAGGANTVTVRISFYGDSYPNYPHQPSYPSHPSQPSYPSYPSQPSYPQQPTYPHQPNYPHQPSGYSYLNAQRSYCGPELCTYQINWSAGYGSNTVLTVQEVGSYEGEKLMACEGQTASASAPWISRGKQYIFRVYVSSQCTQAVGQFTSPSAQTVVQEY
jgi:hypothetical protein